MVSSYSVSAYGDMIADAVRMDAYAAALERTVRPGCVVLDIGTGTGMLALLACRAGAARVYGIEPGDAVHVAREIARANGMADRITFIQGLSTEIDLPERADVIVSDLRGALPLLERHIPAIADARERHLAPGGVLVPRADTLRAAPVDSAEAYARLAGPWDDANRGFDLSPARRVAINEWTKTSFTPAQLLADPATWATLDYRCVADPDVRGEMAWTARRQGTAHGFAAWFETELADGIGYGAGPGTAHTIYGTGFFPFERPVAVAEGDRIAVDLHARLAGDEYVWIWNTRIHPAADEPVEFRQSTFFAEPLSPERLRRRAHGHRPRLTEDGEVERMILGRMDGGATLEEIAREAAERFPARFPRWEDALTRVGRVAETYGS